MRRKVSSGGFWSEVIAQVRALPDELLLRLIERHLREIPTPRINCPVVEGSLMEWRWVSDGSLASLELEFQRPATQTPPESFGALWVDPSTGAHVPQDAPPRPAPPQPAFSQVAPSSGLLQPPPTRCEQGATPSFDRLTPTIRRPDMPGTKSWVRPRPLRLPDEQRAPVHLTVLQIPEVRRIRDVFRCDVFEAHIRARTCLARQYTARELEKVGRGAARQRLGPKTQYAACLNCPVGQQLQKQVVAVDKGEVMKKVVRVRDGRLPKRYASGPDRD